MNSWGSGSEERTESFGSFGTRGWLAAATLALLAALVAALAGPGPTRAQEPSDALVVSAAEAVDRSCFARELGGAAGVDSISLPGVDLTDAAYGTIEARLEGPAGSDWDLTVFDDSTGEVVAASAFRGASEVASGYLTDGGPLTVQACRRTGEGTDAELSVVTDTVGGGELQKSSLAFVEIGSAAEQAQLDALGLDVTEHGGDGFVAVVLRGAADREALERAGLDYEIETPNMDRQAARDAARDDRLRALGWLVLRFTAWDIRYRPEWVATEIDTAIRTRRAEATH